MSERSGPSSPTESEIGQQGGIGLEAVSPVDEGEAEDGFAEAMRQANKWSNEREERKARWRVAREQIANRAGEQEEEVRAEVASEK